ncbi:MAG: AAA family ATPase [Sphaerochaetaceae bacterium]|nr:AAA family ATPase [Sphaerochaetaceae bacterium]
MRIAISGMSGCGNTTVSTMVSQRLGYPVVNFTFRQLAAEKGVSFKDFCAMAEKDDNIDRELDSRMVEMARKTADSVLGSRLAIWNMPDADLKVYLKASDRTRAVRICKREGGDVEQRMAETRARDAHDSARYMRIYGIDNTVTDVADLVIETDDKTPEEITDIILKAVCTKREK